MGGTPELEVLPHGTNCHPQFRQRRCHRAYPCSCWQAVEQSIGCCCWGSGCPSRSKFPGSIAILQLQLCASLKIPLCQPFFCLKDERQRILKSHSAVPESGVWSYLLVLVNAIQNKVGFHPITAPHPFPDRRPAAWALSFPTSPAGLAIAGHPCTAFATALRISHSASISTCIVGSTCLATAAVIVAVCASIKPSHDNDNQSS